jgi:hemerythrin-like domain-containing protein
MDTGRRNFLIGAGAAGVGLVLAGCGRKAAQPVGPPDVTAPEDLMREHGVLRRVLFVYSETAERLRNEATAPVAGAIFKAATLFQQFGEEYHEKKLEEAHIFPEVKKAGGEAGGYVDTLIAQHERGREITRYILDATRAGGVIPNVSGFITAMESLVRMYRPHAAREDTVIFPAWKVTITAVQLDEMNDMFEDIEREQFGGDGFENAVKQIAAVEAELGLADLAAFTAAKVD